MTTNDNEWYNKWQRIKTSDNEWQRVVQWVTKSGTTSDSEWQQGTTNDNEWQRMTTSGTKTDTLLLQGMDGCN